MLLAFVKVLAFFPLGSVVWQTIPSVKIELASLTFFPLLLFSLLWGGGGK